MPLNFIRGAEQSNLFGSVLISNVCTVMIVTVFCLQAPPDVMREIKQERITINFHNHCLTPANFTKSVRILTKLNT